MTGALEVTQLAKAPAPANYQQPIKKPISAHVIRLNNFTLWSASGCVLPYLSVYFLHYTRATHNDVGQFMFVSSLLGILTSFLFGSLADRYQAHRAIYLSSLMISYASYLALFIPILWTSGSNGPANDEGDNQDASKMDVTYGRVWFYAIGVFVAIGNMSSAVNMNFSDSFATNLARLQQTDENCTNTTSFGTLRFFGSIGWLGASFGLSLINSYFHELPYLLPSWLLFVLFATSNILIVLFWPDGRPFDLAEQQERRNSGAHCTKFKPSKRDGFLPCTKPSESVHITKHQSYSFDTPPADENERAPAYPNVRRCSIAPLGNSYICEQFVIGGQRRDSAAHFKFVAKIEPMNAANLTSLAHENSGTKRFVHEEEETTTTISLRTHLKIIELIARRNKNMLRFMFLYTIIGSIISLNWIYLFPYLESLNEHKFKTLSAYVMISSYLSETLFYYLSARITPKLSPSNGLSLVLAMFALRYSLYLAFSLWPAHTSGGWPLELIILVELLMQCVTQGWFECIFNESALEFALEAEHCVPKLIELKLIADTRESIEQVKNGVKLTLFSVSSCCFEGLGVGVGSLIGGQLIHSFGYLTLWCACITLALSVCALNIALEFVFKPAKTINKLDNS